MLTNFEVIDTFLTTGKIPEHWVFQLIQEGYTPVADEMPKAILEKLYENTKKDLEPFKPLNEDLWIRIFGPTMIPDYVTVWLVVGAPKGREAVVRSDGSGQLHLIVDLGQICSYSSLVSRLHFIIFDFLTHELAHVLIGQKYRYLKTMPRDLLLRQLAFDEGIAHFLSFDEDVLSIEWDSQEMVCRRQSANERFNYFLQRADQLTYLDLKAANKGPFWDKYASIAGMFAMVDYCQNEGNLENLLADGPKFLTEFIQ